MDIMKKLDKIEEMAQEASQKHEQLLAKIQELKADIKSVAAEVEVEAKIVPKKLG